VCELLYDGSVSLALYRLLILCAISVSGLAQTSATGGALEGTITDASGGRIPNTAIQARDVATGRQREVSSDAQGAFRLSELPAGTYEVNVSQAGFAPYRHAGVVVTLGTTVHLDVALRSAAVTSQVTVSAQPSPIDPAQTSVSSSVDKERIEELPVESRNYLNFVLLAAGVSPSADRGGSSPGGASPDSGFSFGGVHGEFTETA
jgi:hypothetical protein